MFLEVIKADDLKMAAICTTIGMRTSRGSARDTQGRKPLIKERAAIITVIQMLAACRT